jgi:hypothetical protein
MGSPPRRPTHTTSATGTHSLQHAPSLAIPVARLLFWCLLYRPDRNARFGFTRPCGPAAPSSAAAPGSRRDSDRVAPGANPKSKMARRRSPRCVLQCLPCPVDRRSARCRPCAENARRAARPPGARPDPRSRPCAFPPSWPGPMRTGHAADAGRRPTAVRCARRPGTRGRPSIPHCGAAAADVAPVVRWRSCCTIIGASRCGDGGWARP